MKIEQLAPLLSFGALALGRPNPQANPDLTVLPSCAQSVALQAAASSGCALTNAECFCRNNGFVQSLELAITTSCSGVDQTAACAWATAACSLFGVTLPCATTAATSGSQPNSITGMATSTIASETPATSSMVTTSTIMTNSMQSLATGGPTMTSNGTWTSPTSTPGPTQFTGAAGAAMNTHKGLFGAIAGVALMFGLF